MSFNSNIFYDSKSRCYPRFVGFSGSKDSLAEITGETLPTFLYSVPLRNPKMDLINISVLYPSHIEIYVSKMYLSDILHFLMYLADPHLICITGMCL